MKKLLFIFTLVLISCNNSEKKTTIPIEKIDVSDSNSNLDSSIERGANIYTGFCMQCHLPNGKGIPNTFPPLAGSNWLTEKRTESIHSVKYGQNGPITVNGLPYNGVMIPMGLSDQEIADVLNYVMNSWGNTQEKVVTPSEVAAVKK